jgi:hypothetical protein
MTVSYVDTLRTTASRRAPISARAPLHQYETTNGWQADADKNSQVFLSQEAQREQGKSPRGLA